jgi:hypothetical protein
VGVFVTKKIARDFFILLSAVIVTCILLPLPASALEVTPYELEFKISPSQEQIKLITVSNDSDEKVTYLIYTDEKYQKWFTFNPAELTLEPQQSREVAVILKTPLISFGKHDAYIFIAPQQHSSGNPVVLGMKLKASIDIGISMDFDSEMTWLIIVIVAGILTLLLLFFVVIRPLTRRY